MLFNINKVHQIVSKGIMFIRRRSPIILVPSSIGTMNVERKDIKKDIKRYKKLILEYKLKNTNEPISIEKDKTIIWIFWQQGIENAPKLVQEVVSNNLLKLSQYDVRVLSQKDVDLLIDVPEHIQIKWREGIIGNAHYSDIIRIMILLKYGGMWLDSTVLVTGNNIPEYITNNKLFLFMNTRDINKIPTKNLNSNWLIYVSETHNPVLEVLLLLLTNYWKRNNTINNYFMFHTFLTAVFYYFPEYYSPMIKVSNVHPHFLQQEMFSKFSRNKWDAYKKLTDFHKLTYKINVPESVHDTFYDELINRGNI
ncbi:capsular polysaccharide synthesis protein [Dellaglioa algida]|uniref:Capsular polysaccharide biosynthesis protein n=1 Tax=Dellaglioa algida TaxID=105612 RepID=A0A5C6MAF2_9LACO|nr:capsular polysaccharide synthesis protein [Dellaglioa algida]MDK1717139.1 capsular polysaccharide synthesis protein [Dellaglioa algida]MDK1719791.1 capsular polysaccharide synthesis protein [Dellaglioa algida]MDK1722081.1 capsular polysaccharide synthesis protein [Dellaglioa algida]MDK1723134.1 capsular polysaccharide synthesis protein [Dellaglioa algida]MDK1739914.1 capsular polysaccharide synthesis protein [Dellaglioa algida]